MREIIDVDVLHTTIDLRPYREALLAAQQSAAHRRDDGWGNVVPPVTEGLSRRQRKRCNQTRWAGRRSAAAGIALGLNLIVGDGNFGTYSDAAMAFLVDLLYLTPVRSTEARAAWRAAGFRDIAIRRAQRRLGIKPYQVGFHGGWWWALPQIEGDRDVDPEEYLREDTGRFGHSYGGGAPL